MRRRRTSEEARIHREDALLRAEQLAGQLREILRLREGAEKFTWEEAMRRVGLSLPHTSLRRKLDVLREKGVVGLVDQRHAPPSRLTPEIRGFIEGVARADAERATRQIAALVLERFRAPFAVRTIEDVLHQSGLSRPVSRYGRGSQLPPRGGKTELSSEPRAERVAGLGLMWATVGDEICGYTRKMAEAIQEVASGLPEPSPLDENDQELRDEKGRFLPEYNAARPRRDVEIGACFESVETKREDKDMGRLATLGARLITLQRKLRAVMALPIVTDRGHFDGATDVRGTWLAGLGWLDYMPETLAKFARELKWAGVSDIFVQRHAQLCHEILVKPNCPDPSMAILYVDATTKPLWTEHFHKSGKVSSLGRVMPSVETVLIHKGPGVPLYVATFSGHVALVKNILPLISELESAIGEGMLGRLTVMDGEMDCVALFKQFDQAHRYFITPLDSARFKNKDNIEGLRHLVPYGNGDWIGGGWVHLRDSKAPEEPPYKCRVIVRERRTKETWTILGTNAPLEEFSDAFLVDSYFSRWPQQELVFRSLNQAVAFKAVHGYGKRRVVNVSVIDKLTALNASLERITSQTPALEAKSEDTSQDLRQCDTSLSRAKQKIKTARKNQQILKDAGKRHTKAYGQHKQRETETRKELELLALRQTVAHQAHDIATHKLETNQKQIEDKKAERDVLKSRQLILETDSELDQTISILKVGLMLVLRYIFMKCFSGLQMDINTFINQILILSGTRIRTDDIETIRFEWHRRNPTTMKALEIACDRFNQLQHYHDGRLLRFEVERPPGEDHAT